MERKVCVHFSFIVRGATPTRCTTSELYGLISSLKFFGGSVLLGSGCYRDFLPCMSIRGSHNREFSYM